MRGHAHLGMGLLVLGISMAPVARVSAQASRPEVEQDVARDAASAEEPGERPVEQTSDGAPVRARRGDVRPRWGLSLGGFSGVDQYAGAARWRCFDEDHTYDDLGRLIEGASHCEELGVEDVEYVFGGPLVALQVGVQSDWVGGFLLARLMFGLGSATLLHITLGLVAEVTLFDVLQIGVGPSLDAFYVSGWGESIFERHGNFSETEAVGAVIGQNGVQEARYAPGLEVRLGLASGGGPYERRGFVATSFFHLTIAGPHTLLIGGLEIGFQTF